MADSISNGIILLLWQLQSDVIASLIMTNNTTVVVIFPNVCLWRHSLCSNLGGVDPEKLYQATLMCQYALCCCIVWPSFLFVDYCFVKLGQLALIFWPNGLLSPLAKNCPYAFELKALRNLWLLVVFKLLSLTCIQGSNPVKTSNLLQ